MREYCSYGSVRGAPGNRRPYRDMCATDVFFGTCILRGAIPAWELRHRKTDVLRRTWTRSWQSRSTPSRLSVVHRPQVTLPDRGRR